jgi:hypothetical protein
MSQFLYNSGNDMLYVVPEVCVLFERCSSQERERYLQLHLVTNFGDRKPS